jgi:hypothetical protein
MEGIDIKGKDVHVKYEFDPDFRKELPGMLFELAKSGNVNLDNVEQVLSDAREVANRMYTWDKLPQIVKAHVDEAVAQRDDYWREKIHNPQATNTQTSPEPGGKRPMTVEEAIKMVGG